MSSLKVLRLGAGKVNEKEDKKILYEILTNARRFLMDNTVFLNIDSSYFSSEIDEEKRLSKVENIIESKLLQGVSFPPQDDYEFFVKYDMFKFMEKTRSKFDIVFLNRILEHVGMDQVLYFIYLLSTITIKEHSVISVIVPDYAELARRLLKENVQEKGFHQDNILLTTEMLNERSDPHASIWTPERIKYFFEYEGRFHVPNVNRNFEYDGRNIYIQAFIMRV